jgi:hypothetical protein
MSFFAVYVHKLSRCTWQSPLIKIDASLAATVWHVTVIYICASHTQSHYATDQSSVGSELFHRVSTFHVPYIWFVIIKCCSTTTRSPDLSLTPTQLDAKGYILSITLQSSGNPERGTGSSSSRLRWLSQQRQRFRFCPQETKTCAFSDDDDDEAVRKIANEWNTCGGGGGGGRADFLDEGDIMMSFVM